MNDPFQPGPPMGGFGGYQPPPNRSRVWLWLLLGGGALLALLCGGCLIWVVYIGMHGPETSVYAGNEVPNEFIKVMRNVGALDNDEHILYFYSDGMTDIRDGFYFVSDKKVAIYAKEVGGSPLKVARFDEIVDLQLYRNESFFEDSQITLELKNGRPISFPVSSETGGDERFFNAIKTRVMAPSAMHQVDKHTKSRNEPPE